MTIKGILFCLERSNGVFELMGVEWRIMDKEDKNKNYAFVDGQNLYMATAKREVEPWVVDLKRFRVYLKDKYHVDKAFYYLGYLQDTSKAQTIYEKIQNAGFILVFKQHSEAMVGNKKGNVDSDIILSVMKRLYKKIGSEYYDNLENLKTYIAKRNEKSS